VTNDETAFREVDQAVAEQEQLEFLKKYGTALIGAAAAFVLGVGGYQVWQAQKEAAAGRAAAEFKTASDTLQKSPEEGVLALEAFSAEAPSGYALMAELKRASSLAGAGKREEALAAYRKLYASDKAPQRLRDLSRLRAASLSAADGRDAVLKDLGEMISSTSALGFYARELQGVAALDVKDYESAASIFGKMAADEAAPEPVRQRAKEFVALALAGKAGVALKSEASLTDVVKSLDEAAARAAAAEDANADLAPEGPESHDGHSHPEEAPTKDPQ
jgi:hypothetical protein